MSEETSASPGMPADGAPWLKFDWFPSGHVLVPQGGKLGRLFVLRQGEVEVERDGVFINSISTPGSIFGEMSLLTGARRAAIFSFACRTMFGMRKASAMIQSQPPIIR